MLYSVGFSMQTATIRSSTLVDIIVLGQGLRKDLGFILAALTVGRLCELGWYRRWSVTAAMLAGNIVLYLPGLLWLGYAIGSGTLDGHPGFVLADPVPGTTTLEKTLVGGLYPFIPRDLLEILAASVVLPGAWTLAGHHGPGGRTYSLTPDSATEESG